MFCFTRDKNKVNNNFHTRKCEILKLGLIFLFIPKFLIFDENILSEIRNLADYLYFCFYLLKDQFFSHNLDCFLYYCIIVSLVLLYIIFNLF